MAQPHQVHDFSRLISTSDTGMAIYGCAFRANGTVIGCAETEVRATNQPSPYAINREAARVAAAKRKQPLSAFVGLMSALGTVFWFMASTLANASYVAAVAQA